MSVRAAKTQYRSGITLVELLAVILIVGLLAAISVPMFTSILKGTALRTAAKSLTDTFSLARQLAITNRYEYHVELDDELTAEEKTDGIQDDSLQEQRYRVYYVTRNAADRANPSERDKVTVRKWRLFPDLVTFDRTNRPPDEIVFNPTGGAYEIPGTSPFELTFTVLHNKTGIQGQEKSMTVSVNKITGRAKAEIAED
jgi:prepilin-type N-terminal cleavage/methylation domain-containing protein